MHSVKKFEVDGISITAGAVMVGYVAAAVLLMMQYTRPF